MRNEMDSNIPCTSCPMQCSPSWAVSKDGELHGSCSGPYPALLAGLRPGGPLQLLFEEEGENFLPCFGEEESIMELSVADVLISFDAKTVIELDGIRYLCGPALFYNVDEEGDIAPLCLEELCQIKQQIAARTVSLRFAGLQADVLRLD